MKRTTRPRCPRCGYDLGGQVATWREACPLEGSCPECGATFAWGKVFYGYREPPDLRRVDRVLVIVVAVVFVVLCVLVLVPMMLAW